MKKGTKKRISILTVACAFVFCCVIFALCFIDASEKHSAAMGVETIEEQTSDVPECIATPQISQTVEQGKEINARPNKPEASKNEVPKSNDGALHAEMLHSDIVEQDPPAEVVEINNYNEAEPVSETNVQNGEEIDEKIEEYDTSEIDKVLLFSLYNNDSEYKVQARNKSIAKVIVPINYNGLPVTAIADSGFGNCEDLTEVVLPQGLKTIGNTAFIRCKNLQKIYIPDTVVSIGNNAFAMCDNLTQLFIPNGIILHSTIVRP